MWKACSSWEKIERDRKDEGEASRKTFDEGTQKCPTHTRSTFRVMQISKDTTALPTRVCAEGVTNLQYGEFETDYDTAHDIDPTYRKCSPSIEKVVA